MKVFIGMESSGQTRREFEALGHHVVSVDYLAADDGAPRPTRCGRSGHMQADVFAALEWLKADGWWPDLAIFHPTCTYLTNSAEWAYKDPDFERYPGVGYHQKLKPETLFGAKRRAARDAAVTDFKKLLYLPIERKAIENPIGVISTRVRKPTQILQPYQLGDDASKATCLWYACDEGEELTDMVIPLDPAQFVEPTERPNGRKYWANQTDTGQNRLSPGASRWKDRSATFPGFSAAFAKHWGKP